MKKVKYFITILLLFFGFMSELFGANSPIVNIVCPTTSVYEGNISDINVSCSITLSDAPNANNITVTLSTGGTASNGTDYSLSATSFLFPKSTSTLSLPFVVTIHGDTAYESDETAILNIAASSIAPQGITNGTMSKTITILNDDYSYSSDHLRNFTQAYSSNDPGNIKLIGNSVLWTSSCCAAANTRNNLVTEVNTDLDSNGTTFNSSSADLILPRGVASSNIKYAALYWQGRLSIGGLDNTTQLQARTAKIQLPGYNSYQTLTSIPEKFNWRKSAGNGDDYQGIADITTYLQHSIDSISPAVINSTGYSQTIWVADILTDTGTSNLYGGWSLVVVYGDNNTTLKNLVVYDGFLGVNTSNSPISIPLSGFLTPSSGTVNASFFIFGGEGDYNSGDKTTLTNSSGTEVALKGGNEVFDSSITDELFANVTTRNPSCGNTLGIDIHSFDIGTNSATPIIGNGQTSTTVNLYSFTGSYADYDTHFPGVFAFATDLYQPHMCYDETIFNSTGLNISGVGIQVNKDDVLRVHVTVKNDGTETAQQVQFLHPFDNDNFPYVANSAYYENLPAHTGVNATDAPGDDLFEYNSTTYLSKVNLGSGTSVSSGGNFNSFSSDASAYATYEFNATVKVLDQNFSNTYQAAYKGTLLDYTSHPVTMEPCSGVRNSFYGYQESLIPLGADIIDTFTTIGNYNSGVSKVIKTKIADKTNDTITAVHLDESNEATVYSASNVNWLYSVIPFWSDSTCSTEKNVLNMSGEQIVIDIPVGSAAATGVIRVKDTAQKDTRFKVVVVDPATLSVAGQQCIENSSTTGNFARVAQCANSEVQYRAAFGDDAYSRCGMSNGKPCLSSNHGSANPADADYNPLYAGELGCYICTFDIHPTCSTDNFAIRPDHFTFTAPLAKMKAGEDYNLSTTAYDYSGNNTQDYNQTVSNLTGAPKLWWNRDSSAQIMTVNTQGTTTIAGAWNITNGVGSVPIRYSDVGKFTLDLNDSNWAAVDADDTALSDRTIQGDGNVTFIPYDFNISVGTIVNNDGATPSFTYLSSDLNMSARIPITIRAQNKQGELTQNYANNMYERNITITPYVASVTATARGLVPITLGKANANADFVSGSTSIAYNDPLVAKFNFSRDPRVAITPFDVNSSNGIGNDVNISIVDTDSVYGDKNRTLDGNATFVYGRFIPRDIRVFGNVPFTATAWYEVFNAPKINGTILTPSKNESMWYINHLHNDATGGDANITTVLAATHTTLPVSSVSNGIGIESYLFAAETPPYSAKAHIETTPWLWYGLNASGYADPSAGNTNCSTHPCFNINVVPSVGATGSSKDQNVGSKTNKSTSDGAGGWKSTRDYAPAIR